MSHAAPLKHKPAIGTLNFDKVNVTGRHDAMATAHITCAQNHQAPLHEIQNIRPKATGR